MTQKHPQEEISGPVDTTEAAPLAKGTFHDPKELEFRASKSEKIELKVRFLKYPLRGLQVHPYLHHNDDDSSQAVKRALSKQFKT
jgi:hypothetical protein